MKIHDDSFESMSPFISIIPSQGSARRRRMRSGFTLVETLVVITIITVLAMVAFSAAKHLHRSASSAVCVSKTSQIGSAILIDSQDRGGRLPASPIYGILHTGPLHAAGFPAGGLRSPIAHSS
jgi:prepilin-type N-terminal cleavage/methylation domain-containing protein